MQELFLNTADGFPLSVKIFEPSQPNGKLLLINSATGVKQQIYFSFAKFFAAQGFTVITYDYRGIGESKPADIRNFHASMRIWGNEDFKTLTTFIKENYKDHEKYGLGHSVGALIIGMNPDAFFFKKFIFVATQDAYFGNLKFGVAVTALLGFGLALPLTTSVLGYFPAHFFGLGESLPKGVAYDWQTLILNKESTAGLYEKAQKEVAASLDKETLILHAEDDAWVTRKGMGNLLNNVYPNLKATFREIKICESPRAEIGHINFFRSFNKDLWQIILNDL
ncbi:alpha/beta hydrolase family protein [Kaistella palustris]|uniref:alpha/beta hydrolase family protein n=1 Tax=Kaistella palustris TaxID=493376 RepID=UPI00041EDA6C|nr:alpha/beta fold hydrolase [Kaistella palustris]